MNSPPARLPGTAPEPAADDLSIPILTERLGLPPLEFDTTLPLIETTGQMTEPQLEGLTALPGPNPPAGAAPYDAAAALHPIAALPFPAFPEEMAAAPGLAPLTPAPPAPATLATLSADSAVAGSGGFFSATYAPAIAPAVAPAPAAFDPRPESSPGVPAVERRATPGQHWGRIEVDLRSSILRQITEQLPREIDAIVQGRMQEAIERLLTNLAEEIHLAVTASLGDIVEHAVRAELDRMRNSNRG
jgi:hypothetical protein